MGDTMALKLLLLFSCQFVSNSFETPQTIAHQTPLSPQISQTRIPDWFAISFSRGSSQPRDRTHISCIGRWVLYH